MNPLFVYDIEVYPNFFSCVFKEHGTENWWYFDHTTLNDFLKMIHYIKSVSGRMVGFNNVAFDWPIIERAILSRKSGEVTPQMIYAELERNFAMDDFDKPIRYPSIPQIDLYLIHHFDNSAKRTSLKDIEFVIKMPHLEDLPVEPGVDLTSEQMSLMGKYNYNDVEATDKLLIETKEMIDFRDALGPQYTNYNDVRVGTEILAEKLQPDRKGRTYRPQINISEIILPIVKFDQPEFQRVLNDFRSRTIYPQDAKGALSGLHATIEGLNYHFGVGGLHASVTPSIYESSDTHMIVDLDVASYYPNLATSWDIYPEHIGEKFCDVYRDMYEIRKKYPKGSTLNQAMKLALNGSFGKTGSEYSWLYDPQYTFKITVNGQLLLAMFCEWLLEIPDLEIIQANTDGVTVMLPRINRELLEKTAAKWESLTKLTLEDAEYSRMWVRDVNNYVAEYTNGKLKRKGAYEYEGLPFHKDHSMLVVQKAAQKVLVDGIDPVTAVITHSNLYDFMLRSKVRRSDKTVDENGVQYQRINRFVVTTDGVSLFKVMPPKGTEGDFKRKNGITDEYYQSVLETLPPRTWDERIHTKNKSVYQSSKTAICSGRKVTICNNLPTKVNIDYDFYISEVRKLTEVFK